MKESPVTGHYQFVSFCIDSQWYCFDIRLIREVNQNTDIMEIPLSEAYIRGLVNIRGQVVLVLDLNVLLGASPCSISATSQIIILKTSTEISETIQEDSQHLIEAFGDKPICFIADDIGDVITATSEEIELPPQHLPEKHAGSFDAVILRNGILYSVLNIPALIDTFAYKKNDATNLSKEN
jgi:chemotaxis signal transduction protein